MEVQAERMKLAFGLESYVSINASAFTDALMWSGLVSAKQGLVDAWRGGDHADANEGRAQMDLFGAAFRNYAGACELGRRA